LNKIATITELYKDPIFKNLIDESIKYNNFTDSIKRFGLDKILNISKSDNTDYTDHTGDYGNTNHISDYIIPPMPDVLNLPKLPNLFPKEIKQTFRNNPQFEQKKGVQDIKSNVPQFEQKKAHRI
jgi:hypothetical protein